ncbi:MAG: hypothetical protein ACJ731_06230 [Vicinamibacterales bacterium]
MALEPQEREAVMEPLLIELVLVGLSGGLALSFLIARNRRGNPPTFVPRRLDAPTPALINMAQIRVEGIGGLGMVAAVVAVALADSRIRTAIIAALVLGVGLALGLIAWRRRGGPLPSAGGGPDDRSLLHLEKTEFTTKERSERRPTKSLLLKPKNKTSSFVFVNSVSSL